ncbi:stanniocalcin-like isoform X1 [Chiloscyllium plagiosum]|uniref:stanniocalcin-like isoform X1 n=1 Tax=Chiloscyllium plagiosum TaxID=36176 RepID=UPI001CB878B2|nr:stanniocalcin-like isoform X1 [Chiloscyllium plagiosum]
MEGYLSLLLFLARLPGAAEQRAGVKELPAAWHSSGAAPEKARGETLRAAVEINNCLKNAPEVGCAVFECLENSTCDLDNLYKICSLLLQNAGSFNTKGKQFIKDFLKCNAVGIKSRFSCSIRRCPAIQEILSELQEACYQKNDICAVANDNVDAFAEMIDLHNMLSNRAYLEFVKVLFDCDTNIADTIRRSIQTRFGPKLGILRRMIQDDSCRISEKATLLGKHRTPESTVKPERVSRRGRSLGLDNLTSRGEYWNQKTDKPVHRFP